jgi:hypothetical protein
MSQTLIPFKAFFQLQFDDTLSKHILESTWNNIFSDKEQITGFYLARNISTSFNIPYFKKVANLNFDFDTISKVYSEFYKKSELHSNFRFNLNTYPITVLQILDNKITFSNNINEIFTVCTTEDLKLIKS